MPLHYLHRLGGNVRDDRSDRHLGYWLAFVGGAVNAGAFLVIGRYTSHMTGIVTSVANSLALGDMALALAALVAWVAFVIGSATSAILINWARRRQMHSQYALSLLLEAVLLLLFGLAGSHIAEMRDLLAPVTVLMLCFIMGLQNAIITKMSGYVIRSTHVTGMSTDIGIELGKMIYLNDERLHLEPVRANHSKMMVLTLLISYFFLGGVAGALGFKYIGYATTIVLAVGLTMVAAGPVWQDLRGLWQVGSTADSSQHD